MFFDYLIKKVAGEIILGINGVHCASFYEQISLVAVLKKHFLIVQSKTINFVNKQSISPTFISHLIFYKMIKRLQFPFLPLCNSLLLSQF
jgi:hypothetical protein